MSKMVFRRLYIFSSSEKKAKCVEFAEGKNIITASANDGTDRGKSVIMKSLYHALGADCFFSDLWDEKGKSYIVNFSVDGTEYYVYRNQTLFKAFDGEQRLLFSCVSRHELSAKLYDIFKFAAKLPNRANERLEIVPPAYNYILNFLDQDKQDGPSFRSFSSLAQYRDFKENLLFYHFGAFDESYYELMQQIEKNDEAISKAQKEYDIAQAMLERIYAGLQDVTYSSDFEHLERDVARTKEKYSEIARTLSSIRTKLIELRNEHDELMRDLDLLKHFEGENEKNIDVLREHICPLCRTELSDAETLDLRIAHFSASDDIMLLRSDRLISLNEKEREITKQEAEYRTWLARLEEYEQSLNLRSKEVNDVLRHKGLVELKDKTADDLHQIHQNKERLDKTKKELGKKKKGYADKKDAINKKYYELMLSDKALFDLEEIDPKSLEKITSTFTADGSNKPIATVMWYINLIKVKGIFAPDSIRFPIVFDSPNNVETDTTKRLKVFRYLCERVGNDTQLIVSGLGYSEEAYEGVSFDKVITLDNDKYSLLCERDYIENLALFEDFNRAM
jgi:hypothetical protein